MKPGSPKYSPTRPSGIGRSRWSDRSGSRGLTPEKAYKAKEIKELKDKGTRSETAPPVIKKIHGHGAVATPLNGLFETTIKGKPAVVEYEPDLELRDTEQIPLLHEGGIDAFLEKEVLPYAPDAWYVPGQSQGRVRDQLPPALLQARSP